MARIPFDLHRLYSTDDPGYGLWLSAVLARVDELAATAMQQGAQGNG